MKRRVQASCILAGLTVCLASSAIYAVCVTPSQLTKAAHDFGVDKKSIYETNDEKNKCLFVHDLIKQLAETPAKTLEKQTVVQLKADLDADTTSWQKLDISVNSGTPAKSKTELEMAQKWASYGELVVAIGPSITNARLSVAVVVPHSSTLGSTGAWKDLPIPYVAYAGDPETSSKFAVSDGVKMDSAFSDPKGITFYRYKN